MTSATTAMHEGASNGYRLGPLFHTAMNAALLTYCEDHQVTLSEHEVRQAYIAVLGELIDRLAAMRKALGE